MQLISFIPANYSFLEVITWEICYDMSGEGF